MRRVWLSVLTCTAIYAATVDPGSEHHHAPVLANDRVRVWRLHLPPGEATGVHYHKSFYGVLSLRPAQISNEVPGHKPVVSTFDEAEVHTSRGGFDLVERNVGPTAADLIVFEPVVDDENTFATPMGEFAHTGAFYGELFDKPGVRAYSLKIAPGKQTENHVERYDRLLIAVSEAALEDVTQDGPKVTQWEAGEAHWFDDHGQHSLINVGTSSCVLAVVEFAPPRKIR